MGLERFLTAGLIILAASASLSTAAQGSEGGADYLFFGEQHEALEWFARYESRSRAGLGLPARAVVPESDPRYAVTERKLSVIWDAFKSAYPEATAGLREPKLVILEDPVKNAYALYERATRTLPYLFVVQTGLIEGLSEDEMLGVMAHELAHLVFKHVLPGVSDRVQNRRGLEGRGERVSRKGRGRRPVPVASTQRNAVPGLRSHDLRETARLSSRKDQR